MWPASELPRHNTFVTCSTAALIYLLLHTVRTWYIQLPQQLLFMLTWYKYHRSMAATDVSTQSEQQQQENASDVHILLSSLCCECNSGCLLATDPG